MDTRTQNQILAGQMKRKRKAGHLSLPLSHETFLLTSYSQKLVLGPIFPYIQGRFGNTVFSKHIGSQEKSTLHLMDSQEKQFEGE